MRFNPFPSYAIIKEVQAAATAGQSSVTGAWYTRTLNTVSYNGITGASLATDQVTLPAGTYWINGLSHSYNTQGSQCRLYNVTGSAVLGYGSSSRNDYQATVPAADCSTSFVNCIFTLGSASVIELQYAANRTGGFLGVSQTWADCVYANLTISKLPSAPQIAIFNDEKATNTAGGTFTAGAWRTRTLNTTHYNGIIGASLATDQVTLPAGTYLTWAQAVHFRAGSADMQLYNVTDAAILLTGSTQYCHPTVASGRPDSANNIVQGLFTLAAPKAIEVRHYCNTGGTTTGFGYQANVGGTEIYCQTMFAKL